MRYKYNLLMCECKEVCQSVRFSFLIFLCFLSVLRSFLLVWGEISRSEVVAMLWGSASWVLICSSFLLKLSSPSSAPCACDWGAMADAGGENSVTDRTSISSSSSSSLGIDGAGLLSPEISCAKAS